MILHQIKRRSKSISQRSSHSFTLNMTHSDDDCGDGGHGGGYAIETYTAGEQRSSNEMPEVHNRDRLDFRMSEQPPEDMMERNMPLRISSQGGAGRYTQSANTGVS